MYACVQSINGNGGGGGGGGVEVDNIRAYK